MMSSSNSVCDGSRINRRERAPETKDFDDHTVHQRGNVQRAEPWPARVKNDPGNVGRMK
jgi:hypothetical protein